MLCGVILNIFNHIHYKEYYLIICKFIPELLMLGSVFGYLCIAIVYKWCYNWFKPDSIGPPPSLLNMLIYLFMSPGTVRDEDRLYKGQVI